MSKVSLRLAAAVVIAGAVGLASSAQAGGPRYDGALVASAMRGPSEVDLPSCDDLLEGIEIAGEAHLRYIQLDIEKPTEIFATPQRSPARALKVPQLVIELLAAAPAFRHERFAPQLAQD
jgi:hypothetical protein